MALDIAMAMAMTGSALFGASSVAFRDYSRKISPTWVNSLKAHISLVFLGLCLLVLGLNNHSGFSYFSNFRSILFLILSGFLGLCVADFFLMRAFASLGSARTLMIFTFQPILIGLGAFVIFSQKLSSYHFAAVAAMSLCLFVFSLESFRKEGHWNLKGLAAGLTAMCLDAAGIFATRQAFENHSDLGLLEANFIRALGAVLGFTLITAIRPIGLIASYKKLLPKHQTVALLASFLGSTVSLLLWIGALSQGHLASISTLAAVSPMTATLTESIRDKKWPSKYFYISLGIFFVGFYFLQKGMHPSNP